MALKAWLIEHDRWQGRGYALIINDELIRDVRREQIGDDADKEPGLLAQLCDQMIVATLVHELAHRLEYTCPYIESDELRAVELTETYCRTSERLSIESQLPSWLHHDARWVRIVLHCQYRAAQLGHRIPLSLLIDSQRFELSSPYKYKTAIGDEPQRLVNESFEQIRSVRPPIEFVRTWDDDVQRWFTAQPDERTDLSLAAMRVFSNPEERSISHEHGY